MARSAQQKRFLWLADMAAVAALIVVCAATTAAQSTEIEYPTPVRAPEIRGTIDVRDVGDPRLTRYFYLLMGTHGDLVVTVESRNLDGDVDIFTAVGLRPLTKISIYSGGQPVVETKSVYLRQQVPLILRVEARSPNDNPGSYRIRFDGSFLPVGGTAEDDNPPPAVETNSARNGKRVTSVGGRIDEPEAPASTSSSPTPATETPSPVTTRPKSEPAISTPTAPVASESPTPTPSPSRRIETEQPVSPRVRTPEPEASPKVSVPTTESREPERTTPAESRAEPARRRPARSGPRLIIETRRAIKIERYMTEVRRVTVEDGEIVVLDINGNISRYPLANVVKMSIEP
jgi:hypothetical protein